MWVMVVKPHVLHGTSYVVCHGLIINFLLYFTPLEAHR
jgi:hypothetical protein